MGIIKNTVKKVVKDTFKKPLEESEEEPMRLTFATGLIPDPEDERDYKYKSLKSKQFDISNLPKRVDYSNEMSPVKSQQKLGSCVAFALAAVKEGQEKKEYLRERKKGSKYKRNSAEYDLSEMGIYKNCKKIDNFPDSEGTTIRAGLKTLNKLGVPKEKAGPYTDNLNEVGKPTPGSKMTARGKKIKGYYKLNSIEEVVDHLYNHGPLVTGVLVFSTGNVGPDGHVRRPSDRERPQGAHAVAITGYDKSEKRERDYKLFFKNSGTENWGNGGFGWFSCMYWKEYALDTGAIIDKDVKKKILDGEFKGLG